MQSKVSYDLGYENEPIIKVKAVASDDVRDKIARRFVETFRHGDSQWCEILPCAENEYWVWPIKPEELRRKANEMLLKADEIEKSKEATKQRIEAVAQI